MALNEKMLPLGKTKQMRTGDYLYTMEVVGWNEKLKCNVWAEKSKKYSPVHRVNTYQLVEAIKESEDWEYAKSMAKRIKKEIENQK